MRQQRFLYLLLAPVGSMAAAQPAAPPGAPGIVAPPAAPIRAAAADPDVMRRPVVCRNAVDLAEQIRVIVGPEVSRDVFVSRQTNEIIVRGGPEAQRLVAQVIAKLDRPPAADSQPELEAYPIAAGDQLRARRYTEAFRGGAGERAAWDARTGQLIVFASPGVHADVRRRFNLPAGPASDATDPAPTGGPPQGGGEGIRLLLLSAEQLHSRMQRLAGKPLAATWGADRRWLSFPIELGAGSEVKVSVDAASGTAFVEGDPAARTAWRRVIAAMDGGESTASPAGHAATRVAPASRGRKDAITRALGALGEVRPLGPTPGRLVAMQVNPPGGADAGGRADDADSPRRPPRPPGEAAAEPTPGARGAGADSSLTGPVQVEFVEGLDIIVLRGSDRDVARVMEIINEIERYSLTTAPEIAVQPLAHVASVPLAELLVQIYSRVLGPRSGSVSITPLGKPNSLLLIGRPENVRRAVELAVRLDKPVEPATRFRAFPLRHATASEAKTLIDEYLAGDEEASGEDGAVAALPPTARVVADFRSNTLVVSAAPRELAEIAAIVKRIDVAQATAVDEVRVFPLRSGVAADLAEVLRQAINQSGDAGDDGDGDGRSASLRFVAIDAASRKRLESGIVTGVRIAPDERANALVVTAPAESMDLIAALIAQLDRSPDAVAELKVFTIANGDAVALVETLRTLFGTEEADDRAGGVGASASTLVRLTFSVDERTNSIIATGSREDLDVVYAVLTRLDGADTRKRINRVFRLNNASAVNVAQTLTEWLDSRSQAEEEAELTISPFEQIDREVILVADEASNSIVISATPTFYDEIAELIGELDERPPMVTMQVLIAEVRLNDIDEFGIELGLQDSLLFDRSLVGDLTLIETTTQNTGPGGAVVSTIEQNIIGLPLETGFNFNNVDVPLGNNGSTNALANAGQVAAQGLVNFGVGRTSAAGGFGGFVLSASSNAVDMLLRALQENRRLEVLSRPQITMLDNQPGRITVGQNVQRISSVNVDQLGQQSNSLESLDVGIILEVTPRISPDGQVVMQVAATRSELGEEADGTPVFVGQGGVVVRAPPVDQIVAETTVMASSGQTIVLGGLISKRSLDIHRQVPILADIPLLGDLFRFDSVQQERSELMIIITPRVIRSEQDAEMIKQVESARMSWVLCDVINLHGPSGLRSRCADWDAAGVPEVFPSFVPAEGDLQPSPSPGRPSPAAPATGEGPAMPLDGRSPPGPLPPPGGGLSRDDGAAAERSVETAGYTSPAAGRRAPTPPALRRLPPIPRPPATAEGLAELPRRR